ncbi:MAG: methyltransferase domain-containing protein, partial [Coriobacteriales bacterium]|nr:methyltransferase domain-containing protein [Coriobacteriales bacterium]
MNFPKADTFPQSIMRERSMGPNPLKLCEELLGYADIPAGSVVLDLGSGAGLTSALMARECGFTVYAADLWSDPSDNMRFFEEMGLTNRRAVPLKADATALPFAHGFFDAVVSVDSYNYFGRDPLYLGEHLLPLVRRGGEPLFAIPGMARDRHDDLPACLHASTGIIPGASVWPVHNGCAKWCRDKRGAVGQAFPRQTAKARDYHGNRREDTQAAHRC